MNALINTLIEFLLVMAVGFLIRKINILDDSAVNRISKLIVDVTMPAMVFGASLGFEGDKNKMWISLGVGTGIYLLLPFLAKGISLLFRLPKGERGVYEFMMIFGNVGFMGLPLVQAVFGNEAVIFASVMHELPFNLLAYTYGIYLYTKGTNQQQKLSVKEIFQPGVVAVLLSVIVLGFGIKVPTLLADSVQLVGRVTTPLSMMVIGASFVGISLKKSLSNLRIYLVLAVRLLLVPILGYLAMKGLGVPQELCNMYACTAGLPVAASAVIYSRNYGKGVEITAPAVFMTTVFSVLSVPLVLLILGVQL